MAFDSDKSETPITEHPLGSLPREDLDLILELVLQSGSLKALAESYGVSYPTIRGRLDRVIERARAAAAGRSPDAVTDLLASLVERGELTASGARRIRDLVRRDGQSAGRSGEQTGEAR